MFCKSIIPIIVWFRYNTCIINSLTSICTLSCFISGTSIWCPRATLFTTIPISWDKSCSADSAGYSDESWAFSSKVNFCSRLLSLNLTFVVYLFSIWIGFSTTFSCIESDFTFFDFTLLITLVSLVTVTLLLSTNSKWLSDSV